PSASQKELLHAYYDREKGIGYSLIRTNIHSCDFSSESYTYVDDRDTTLRSVNVAHDLQYRIPLIKKAIMQAGGEITLFASPWSPPAWMKDNNDMLHGGKLMPQYRQLWASYMAQFIKAYEIEGVPVWGLTVQNEPMAIQTWESCNYTAEEERDFVKLFLGPTLHREGLSDKKIIIWDHNRDLLYQRASIVLNDPEASKYVWGTGFHWYVRDVFDNVKRVKEAFPDKNLLFTEGCCERFNANTISEWKWGEIYGKSMINDFNNGTVGWTDWNILLDQQGGPNHVGNYCFAPVHADLKSGALTYMNSYYYIGHFSKFIRPQAKRVLCSSNRDELLSTAFLNKDGRLVVVVQNATDE
ncbi:MAG: glycoside hydrolase family 30 beta sandwich domain-containing protein, partial [Bacteroidota bacterium]|nr:glycoside hydrolase family 30 beta sandwich domain-containing protein [Bacteroidota bacterium]